MPHAPSPRVTRAAGRDSKLRTADSPARRLPNNRAVKIREMSPVKKSYNIAWCTPRLPASNVTSDVNVTAEFRHIELTLTYTAGTGGSITGETSQTVLYGESGAAVTAVPDEGYEFVRWSDGVTTAARTDSNVTSDVNVTAEFRRIELTLIYTAGAGGSITGETSQTVLYGDNGTEVTAVPDEGYEFVRWSDGRTDNQRTDSNVMSDVTVTAEFRRIELTLTYTAGTGGSITGETSQMVLYGDNGTEVTAVPDEG